MTFSNFQKARAIMCSTLTNYMVAYFMHKYAQRIKMCLFIIINAVAHCSLFVNMLHMHKCLISFTWLIWLVCNSVKNFLFTLYSIALVFIIYPNETLTIYLVITCGFLRQVCHLINSIVTKVLRRFFCRWKGNVTMLWKGNINYFCNFYIDEKKTTYKIN